MSRRDRLARGPVGALSVLVLVQAYELAVGRRLGVPATLGVTRLVGAATVWLVPLVERRVGANGRA